MWYNGNSSAQELGIGFEFGSDIFYLGGLGAVTKLPSLHLISNKKYEY